MSETRSVIHRGSVGDVRDVLEASAERPFGD